MTTQLPDAKLFSFGEHESDSAPPVLLPYQGAWVADQAEVKIAEKSRRIGLTWGEAADDVLVAATEGRDGMDVLYIGYNQEMTREYIQTCAWWAKAYNKACAEIEEFIFDDPDPEKNISAFRITFKSGHEIVALSSRPTNLRGRQGRVVIDEAAFHDDLPGLMKAALALLMWGGQVVVISTHFGQDNYFNTLIEDCRAGRLPYSVHRIDFDEALEDGLYRRICLVRGMEWTEEAEREWRAKIVKSYADDADEELFCIPSRGSGLYLPLALLESRADDVPIVRWQQPDSFAEVAEHLRTAECREWCEAELDPLLLELDKNLRHFFGQDFARSGDLSVIWPLALHKDMVRRPPFIVEQRNIPFDQQRQILFFILDRLPRFTAGKMDATGNGAYLAEVAAQRYGFTRIEQVKLSEGWYRDNMPPWKAGFEDGTLVIPRNADIIADHRAVRLKRGVAMIEAGNTGDKRARRHGDSAIAHVLAYASSRDDKAFVEYAYHPVARKDTLRGNRRTL